MSAVEIATLALSAAAFVTAVASLYVTSLKRADIEADVVTTGGELGRGGAINWIPTNERLQLHVFLSNTGARGGLLEKVELVDFEYIGAEPALWEGLGETGVWLVPYSPHTAQAPMPLALEAGDVETRYIAARWEPDWRRLPRATVALYAAHLRGLEKISVTLRWTYRRTAGPVDRLLHPSGARRRQETRELRVEVPGGNWVEHCRRLWKNALVDHQNPLLKAALQILDGTPEDEEAPR